jgi:RNA polymerase sigma-70 factor (ECF subfamily)
MFLFRMSAAGEAGNFLKLSVYSGGRSNEASGSGKLEEEIVRLFDEHRERIFRYLLNLAFCPEEAEEITQETFLRLYQHLRKNGRKDNLLGWIFRVAHNLAITQRQQRRRLVLPSPAEWEDFKESNVAAAPNPEELLLLKEKMNQVHLTMKSLSPQQKECLFLRVEGLRYREIAEILGVTVSTVAESLRRALVKLASEPARERR